MKLGLMVHGHINGIIGTEVGVRCGYTPVCIGDKVKVLNHADWSEGEGLVVSLGKNIIVLGYNNTAIDKLEVKQIIKSHAELKVGDILTDCLWEYSVVRVDTEAIKAEVIENVKKYIADLDWNNTKEVQENAIEKLVMSLEGEEVILLASQDSPCNKNCWYNAAIVLKEIGYPRNKEAIPYLMNWFQDLNWPGVKTIVELLRKVGIEEVVHIKTAMEKAIVNKDEIWVEGLEYLAQELGITGCFNRSNRLK